VDIGSAVGRRQGLSEEKLLALANFEESDAFTELERLALRYATAMTDTPVKISNNLFDALRQQLNEKQLVELTSCIAWENYRARFDHAFGIEAQGFSQGMFCPLPPP
jgi:alkylhydroperoxidase family enzyme